MREGDAALVLAGEIQNSLFYFTYLLVYLFVLLFYCIYFCVSSFILYLFLFLADGLTSIAKLVS